MLLLHSAHVLRIGTAGGVPNVAQLARAANRPRRAPADPDLRLRRRMRLGGRVGEGPELALEVMSAAPERAHQPDALVGAPAAFLEGHAHEPVLVLVPADADPEPEAAAA